ncbi:pseudouridylate synthase 1 homolog isoform X1 [Gordionus sp. m RMFG-2023]|uniref:pseudouridylate synthase 1 homolog isoform X1 n=1 Tax=Gordionus sp. m RMFG-2023 TaxID=3053472 RepID=UPI0031FC5E65
MSIYHGSHNYHNYTSGKNHSDKSSIRYIMNTEISAPFVKNGIEWVFITIKGQSFMLHQIRKMIGFTMAAIRDLVTQDEIYNSWLPTKIYIPKAPGLGLILKEVHYDWYNTKFKDDSSKNKISFDKYKKEIEEFAHKFVYSSIISTELEQKIIYEWSKQTLPERYALYSKDLKQCSNHDYISRNEDTIEIQGINKSGKALTTHSEIVENDTNIEISIPNDLDNIETFE